MSDEIQLTDQQLVQATSRTLAPNAALDAESAALRDGFLRMGGAVEAASRDFDEAKLLARLQIAGADEFRPLPGRPRSKWLPLVLAGALAASALVAIVRSVAVWSPAQVAVTGPNENKTPQLDIAASGANGGPLSAGWSDPLDDEIASAEDAFERIHRRPGDLDGSLESFGSRLEALAAELESGSL